MRNQELSVCRAKNCNGCPTTVSVDDAVLWNYRIDGDRAHQGYCPREKEIDKLAAERADLRLWDW